MPYKCVNCSKLYGDGSQEVLTGCSQCGRRFFFYIRKEQLEKMKEQQEELSMEEKRQIETDIREIVGVTNEESPIFLDFESVKVLKPGKYLIDLTNLFAKNKPRVYTLEDGKYIIDLGDMRVDEDKQV
jgi:predicted  nucleic acid-binding Zn-ribbon protein